MSIEVIKAFRQNPIVIYPVYLDITGDYATAAALGQVLYWHEVMHGKFYKTDSNFEQELHLNNWGQSKIKFIYCSLFYSDPNYAIMFLTPIMQRGALKLHSHAARGNEKKLPVRQ